MGLWSKKSISLLQAEAAAEGHVFELWHFLTQYVHRQNAPKVDVATASLKARDYTAAARALAALR